MSGLAFANTSGEIAVLKAQNEILKGFISNTSDIVLWSLGFAATFLIAFLGLFAFFSVKRLDDESSRIRESIAREIRDQFSVEQSKNQEIIDERLEIIKDTQIQLQKSIEQEFSKFKEASKSYTRREIDQAVKEIRDESEILKVEILNVRYELYEQEAKRWQSQNPPIHINAARAYVAGARVAQELNHDFRIARSLDGLLRSARAVTAFDTDTVVGFNSFLDGLPDKYSATREEIKRHLKI